MRIGVSTRLLWEREQNIYVILDFIRKHAESAEIWVMPPFFPYWRTSQMKGELDRIREVLEVYGLSSTVHAPHHDLNLSSLNPRASKAAYEDVLKSLESADIMGSETVTFHPGGVRYGRERGLEILKESLKRLDKKAEEYNALLCLENLVDEHMYCRTSGEVLDVLEGLESIHITLDLAHALVQEEDIGDYIGMLGDRIRHVHISDFKGLEHLHLPIGRGDLDFTDALKALKKTGYKGVFSLEGVPQNPFTAIPEETEELRNILGEAGFK
ncbi:MAG: TIM barrel protein [Candidatus Altiarchaeales archaeon]|nr:TIM barrel protein [Candidatus Altiarchaeales archaeon]MBD3416666.1 TIM barrel protein [Candidatus Altiarchaeales archaeon]